jgi:hypothetical protein
VALGDDVTEALVLALGVAVGVHVAVALGDGVPEALAVALDEDVPEALGVTVALLERDAVVLALAELELDGDAVADTVRRDVTLRPRSVMRATSVALPSHNTDSRTPLASRPLGMSCVTLTYR